LLPYAACIDEQQKEKIMRKVVVSEFMSLDGVVEDPGGAENFKYGGWTRDYSNDEVGQFKYEELFSGDALLLGRKTYEAFAKAWPTMEGTGDFGERMNGVPKYVASTTLKKPDWNNSSVIQGDITEAVTKLKSQPGQDILVFGSAALIQTLMKHDLVDQYNLLVFPVVLGTGKRLFHDSTMSNLKLTETRTFSTGVIALIYQPDRKA
jgi:dihydrofolate reductase